MKQYQWMDKELLTRRYGIIFQKETEQEGADSEQPENLLQVIKEKDTIIEKYRVLVEELEEENANLELDQLDSDSAYSDSSYPAASYYNSQGYHSGRSFPDSQAYIDRAKTLRTKAKAQDAGRPIIYGENRDYA